jgi:predicted nuclease with TOPRIM domain
MKNRQYSMGLGKAVTNHAEVLGNLQYQQQHQQGRLNEVWHESKALASAQEETFALVHSQKGEIARIRAEASVHDAEIEAFRFKNQSTQQAVVQLLKRVEELENKRFNHFHALVCAVALLGLVLTVWLAIVTQRQSKEEAHRVSNSSVTLKDTYQL